MTMKPTHSPIAFIPIEDCDAPASHADIQVAAVMIEALVQEQLNSSKSQ